jgi:lysophospholipase L1-like esterase
MSRARGARFALLLAAGALGCQAASTADGTGATGGRGGVGIGGAPAAGAGGAGAGAGAGGAMSGSGGGAGPGSSGGAGGNGRSGTGGAPSSSSGTGGHVADAGVDSGPAADGGGARDVRPDVDQSALPSVTLYLAGDSTVMDYGATSAQEGWGQELGQFLIGKVTISNQAIGGRSIQSFMYDDAANTMEASRWSNVKNNIRAGDYLMVQFGTNDSSGIAGRAVTPAAFQALLGTMIDAVKAKGATPILVTPSALQEWTAGREGNNRLGPYAAAMKTIAPLESVLVDDLNARSVELLNAVGQAAAMQIYIAGDKAHFTKYGATQMAQIVAQELRRIGSPLGGYLK